MTQGELEKIPQKVIDSISMLEMRIMTDIVRRVEENGFLSAFDRWQISRLQQLSEADDQIREWIQDFLQVADEAMEEIISEDVYREYYSHAPAYNLSRTKQNLSAKMKPCSRRLRQSSARHRKPLRT